MCILPSIRLFRGANLYRYKGILALKGVEEKFIFQGVGMLFNGNVSDMKWKIPE